MKSRKLTRRLALFFLPIILINTIWILTGLNASERMVYNRGMCTDRASWLRDRIAVNERLIDVAFVGTSHTWNAIQDDSLTARLSRALGQQTEVANLAICKKGRNMSWLLVDDLLKHRKPRLLVLEVRETESPYSHDGFPFVAKPEQILGAPAWGNRDYLGDVFQMFGARLHMKQLYGLDGQRAETWDYMDYGFGPHDHVMSHDDIRDYLSKRKPRLIPQRRQNYPLHYLDLIQKRCEEAGVPVAYLYLPGFEAPASPDAQAEYESSGPLWLPPQSVFEGEDHWYDQEHFNSNGAAALTGWLAGKVEAGLTAESSR